MLLSQNGYQVSLDAMSGCSNICVARNVMLADFMESGAKCALFIDADLAWNPSDALKLIQSPHDVIGGAYPVKQDGGGFLARVKSGPTKLFETDGLAGGFMKVTRNAVLKMQKKFPELKARYKKDREIYALFDNGIFDGEYTGEDYAFTRRWMQTGGKAFIDPDMIFEHYGRKAWSGSLSDYLIAREGAKAA